MRHCQWPTGDKAAHAVATMQGLTNPLLLVGTQCTHKLASS